MEIGKDAVDTAKGQAALPLGTLPYGDQWRRCRSEPCETLLLKPRIVRTLGRTLGFPVKFSETPASVDRGAPLLGEHTPEVLADLGYTEDEIHQLIRSGAARA